MAASSVALLLLSTTAAAAYTPRRRLQPPKALLRTVRGGSAAAQDTASAPPPAAVHPTWAPLAPLALVGARTPDMVRDALGALRVDLSPSDVESLAATAARCPQAQVNAFQTK